MLKKRVESMMTFYSGMTFRIIMILAGIHGAGLAKVDHSSPPFTIIKRTYTNLSIANLRT